MRQSSRVAAFAMLLSAFSPAALTATTVVSVTAEELALRSDEVIIATVRASASRWEHGLIITDHELVVDAAIRGRALEHGTIFLRTPGGVVGRIAQVIPDAPVLEVGHSYLFFLAGGVGPVRFLAHLTAAVLPVSVTVHGEVVAQPSTSLLLDRSHNATATPPPTPLPAMLDRIRAVHP